MRKMLKTDGVEERKWVKRWENVSRKIKYLQKKENLSIPVIIELLEDAFQSAIRLYPPKPTSGLVEQQKWFRKLRK